MTYINVGFKAFDKILNIINKPTKMSIDKPSKINSRRNKSQDNIDEGTLKKVAEIAVKNLVKNMCASVSVPETTE